MQLTNEPQYWAAKEYHYRTYYKPVSAQSSSASFPTSTLPYVPSLTVPASDIYAPLPPYSPLGSLETHVDAMTREFTVPPQQDYMAAFFGGKQAFLGKSVEDIVGLIYERETMNYDSFRAMDYQAAGIKTKLFEIDNLRAGLNPQIERVRQNIVKELHILESDKRRETVECWRDITRLKGELREVMREFGQEKRKAALLGSPPS